MADQRPPGFRGRSSEIAVLDRLLAEVRGGHCAVLVIRGEAGIGKTALLRYVVQRASGFRVAQIAGVESEMELAYAGLHQLCTPMLDYLGVLPQPQRVAVAAEQPLFCRARAFPTPCPRAPMSLRSPDWAAAGAGRTAD